MRIHVPCETPDAVREKLYKQEGERCKQILAESPGLIKRLWRVNATDNYGLWEAPDLTTVHKAVETLPLFRYMEIDFIPLAANPNDPGQDTITLPNAEYVARLRAAHEGGLRARWTTPADVRAADKAGLEAWASEQRIRDAAYQQDENTGLRVQPEVVGYDGHGPVCGSVAAEATERLLIADVLRP
jgi:muconolactone delta-isomerase